MRAMKGVVMVVALAALAAGCGTAAAAVEPTAPAVVTDDGVLSRAHEAPGLVVDRDDPRRWYISTVEVFTGECRFFASTDGGRTWERREDPTVAPHTDCGLGPASPKNLRTELQQAPDGTLLYAFHAHDPGAGGARSIFLARSGDGGRSWQTSPIHVAPAAERPDDDIELNFLTHLAIDPDDPQRVFAMWRRSFPRPAEGPGQPTRGWMAVSRDGGASFEEPRLAIERDIGFDGPRPLVVDGRLFAFYRARPGPDAPDDALNEVVVAVSDDEGETWTETVIASADDVSEPVPVYHEPTGQLLATWHDNRNGNLDAFFARSTDGTEWTEPLRLNDDPAEATVGQFYPQMAVSADGRIDIAWYDYRDEDYPPPTPDDGPLNLFNNMGRHQSVYVTSSADAGRSWTPNLRVNDVPIDRTIGVWDLNFFFQVPLAVEAAVDGPVVAWSDTRNGDAFTGTQDIVAAAVRPAAASGDWTLLLLGGVVGLLLGAGLATVGLVTALRRRGQPALSPA